MKDTGIGVTDDLTPLQQKSRRQVRECADAARNAGLEGVRIYRGTQLVVGDVTLNCNDLDNDTWLTTLQARNVGQGSSRAGSVSAGSEATDLGSEEEGGAAGKQRVKRTASTKSGATGRRLTQLSQSQDPSRSSPRKCGSQQP